MSVEAFRRDAQVADLACASTSCSRYVFAPRNVLHVNDQITDAHVGDMYYENRMFEIGPALRIHEWVFCLERMRNPWQKADDTPWRLAAFRELKHYMFDDTIVDDATRNAEFIQVVLTRFWHIFHTKDGDFRWKLEPIADPSPRNAS